VVLTPHSHAKMIIVHQLRFGEVTKGNRPEGIRPLGHYGGDPFPQEARADRRPDPLRHKLCDVCPRDDKGNGCTDVVIPSLEGHALRVRDDDVKAPAHSDGQRAGHIVPVRNRAAVPPCGRFGANAAWYRLSLLTYNVLSALKSLALPPHLSTARPKRLRFALFTLAGRLVTHAGQLWLRVRAAAERLAGLIAARRQLVLLAQGLPAG